MASDQTLLIFNPLHNEPPASNFATPDTRNQHPVMDHAIDEVSVFSCVMPAHYGGGGVTVFLHYAMSSATSNDIKLETSFERIGDQQQDVDSDGFAAAQDTGDVTVPGTDGLVDIASTTHTNGAQIDSIAPGEGFRLKIERVAVAGVDATGDLELLFIEMKEI